MNSLVNEEYHVKINVWQDIFTMSKYTDSLDPTKEKLKRVINKYTLPTKGKCGLSNCGTAHNNGYIVETETVVGCAQRTDDTEIVFNGARGAPYKIYRLTIKT